LKVDKAGAVIEKARLTRRTAGHAAHLAAIVNAKSLRKRAVGNIKGSKGEINGLSAGNSGQDRDDR
jgi:hypothetical protein